MRCDECIEAILALSAPRITRLLLEEPYVPERLMERLATDLDAGVALAASERLGAAGAGRETEELEPVDTVSPFASTVALAPVAETATEADGHQRDGEDRVGSGTPSSPVHAPVSEWSDW